MQNLTELCIRFYFEDTEENIKSLLDELDVKTKLLGIFQHVNSLCKDECQRGLAAEGIGKRGRRHVGSSAEPVGVPYILCCLPLAVVIARVGMLEVGLLLYLFARGVSLTSVKKRCDMRDLVQAVAHERVEGLKSSHENQQSWLHHVCVNVAPLCTLQEVNQSPHYVSSLKENFRRVVVQKVVL